VARRARALDPQQLGAYFVLMEVSSILRHAVEQHLRIDGNLSYVQFQVLASLSSSATGSQRMTELADNVVYSRSGLTYQADLLEKRRLISRSPAADDERSIIVNITQSGRALFERVLPGHIAVVSRLLLEPLSRNELEALIGLLTPVRDHMRAAPPRSATPRHRKNAARGGLRG
jgi:DNA-binding MarR family transcriptional regulator